MEYLPVGPKGAPETIFGNKNISGLKSLTPSPSPLCRGPLLHQNTLLCLSLVIFITEYLKMVLGKEKLGEDVVYPIQQ